MLVRAALLICIIAVSIAFAQPDAKKPESKPRDDSASEKLGWKLAAQAWTFNDRTAFEAIEAAHRHGLKYIELFPGQQLRKDDKNVKVGPDMDKAQRDALKEKLAAEHVKLMNYGVNSWGNDEKEARRVFDFARDMGIETITCEPKLDAWDLTEKLAKEYDIKCACHDHPKPSTYWDPQTVLDNVKNRDKRLGSCADTGHWPRSGLNVVECLKKLEGRVISLHFKDISPADKTGKDKPWGTGDNNARGILEELKRQGFKGVISIEYETGGPDLEANVAKCIEWFDQTARELANKK